MFKYVVKKAPAVLEAIRVISVVKNATISSNHDGVITPVTRYVTYKILSRKPEGDISLQRIKRNWR
jgi:hypothetical protein